MSDDNSGWGCVIIIVALIVGIIWAVIQWNECRNEGLSFLFCLGHL